MLLKALLVIESRIFVQTHNHIANILKQKNIHQVIPSFQAYLNIASIHKTSQPSQKSLKKHNLKWERKADKMIIINKINTLTAAKSKMCTNQQFTYHTLPN